MSGSKKKCSPRRARNGNTELAPHGRRCFAWYAAAMTRCRYAILGACVALATLGCNATSPARTDAGSGGEAPARIAGLPSAVACTFFFRESNEVREGENPDDPKFQFQEHTLSVAQNEDDSTTLGKLSLSVRYDVSLEEGASVGIAASTAERQLVAWLYQLDERGVANQFKGDHGFTGLVYLTHPQDGGDYQLICKAR